MRKVVYWERDINRPKYTFYLLGESNVSDELLERCSMLARVDCKLCEQLVGFTAFKQDYLNMGGIRDFVDTTEKTFCNEIGEKYQPVTELGIYSRVKTDTLTDIETDITDANELQEVIHRIHKSAEPEPELHLVPSLTKN